MKVFVLFEIADFVTATPKPRADVVVMIDAADFPLNLQ